MNIDQKNIISVLLVKIAVAYYKQYPYSTPIQKDLLFCDGGFNRYIYNDQTYIGLGQLLGITSSASEISSSSGELVISISGIPNTSIYEILNSRIKGSPVQIRRAYFDPVTLEAITLPNDVNTTGRYLGFVNNYSLQEEYDNERMTASNTLVLTCNSAIDVLANKTAGRKTNQESQQRYFPNDLSMNRVTVLENTTFDFGKGA